MGECAEILKNALEAPSVAAGATGMDSFFEEARVRKTYLKTRHARKSDRTELSLEEVSLIVGRQA